MFLRLPENPAREEAAKLQQYLDDNPNLAGFLKEQHSGCAFCQYRKEKYPNLPEECKECGWLKDRNDPYFVFIPVWKEGYTPEKAEREKRYV